jgi:hypothetical protein
MPETTPVADDANATAQQLQQRAADDYAGNKPVQPDDGHS